MSSRGFSQTVAAETKKPVALLPRCMVLLAQQETVKKRDAVD